MRSNTQQLSSSFHLSDTHLTNKSENFKKWRWLKPFLFCLQKTENTVSLSAHFRRLSSSKACSRPFFSNWAFWLLSNEFHQSWNHLGTLIVWIRHVPCTFMSELKVLQFQWLRSKPQQKLLLTYHKNSFSKLFFFSFLKSEDSPLGPSCHRNGSVSNSSKYSKGNGVVMHREKNATVSQNQILFVVSLIWHQ